MGILESINSILWVTSNVLVVYSAVLSVLFLLTYFILFDPWKTSAGRMIFRFMMSLALVFWISFLAIFIDPAANRNWFEFPIDVSVWRPTLRILAYGFVAYSITALTGLLIIRKWFPQKIKTAYDYHLVEPRTGPTKIHK